MGDAAHGLLCAGCAVGLVSDDVCPEQIRSDAVVGAGASNAFLVDGFGVPHALVVAPTVPGMPIAPSHNCRTVGRSSHCAVAIAERTVSLTHATFEYRPLSNAWFVVDAGSENGVFVNGDRVPRRFPLESRDRVMLGRRLGFVFAAIAGAGDGAGDAGDAVDLANAAVAGVGDEEVAGVVDLDVGDAIEAGLEGRDAFAGEAAGVGSDGAAAGDGVDDAGDGVDAAQARREEVGNVDVAARSALLQSCSSSMTPSPQVGITVVLSQRRGSAGPRDNRRLWRSRGVCRRCCRQSRRP